MAARLKEQKGLKDMSDIKDNSEVVLSVPLKIQDKDTSIVTKTINITSSGAYCKTDKPLPLLSKVVLTLLIPNRVKKGKTDKKIECKGTVVRTHPVMADGRVQSYDVAIYFDDMSPADSKLIAQYVEQHLPKDK
ncbi:MAG: PilZ domain-containing protein [Candidatus Omnitrophota bacterium]